ncbi:hypothetical protein H4219_003183 [Mycoemilia scoparia]|uniref:C3H1-type domain-containing protein n=1 Tax=Mycoemilia scoparia TaxID=417184 RepID=A0A9W8A0Q6_9FUNG|nr:hypothetical protein H4219_003183 [Mycoemilia scoparia]
MPKATVRNRKVSLSGKENDQDATSAERKGGGHNGGSTKHIPCKFFKNGNCTAGANCVFSHDPNAYVERPVCKYFMKGNCKYGNKCALSHGTSGDVPQKQQQGHSIVQGRSVINSNTRNALQSMDQSSSNSSAIQLNGISNNNNNNSSNGNDSERSSLSASSTPNGAAPGVGFGKAKVVSSQHTSSAMVDRDEPSNLTRSLRTGSNSQRLSTDQNANMLHENSAFSINRSSQIAHSNAPGRPRMLSTAGDSSGPVKSTAPHGSILIRNGNAGDASLPHFTSGSIPLLDQFSISVNRSTSAHHQTLGLSPRSNVSFLTETAFEHSTNMKAVSSSKGTSGFANDPYSRSMPHSKFIKSQMYSDGATTTLKSLAAQEEEALGGYLPSSLNELMTPNELATHRSRSNSLASPVGSFGSHGALHYSQSNVTTSLASRVMGTRDGLSSLNRMNGSLGQHPSMTTADGPKSFMSDFSPRLHGFSVDNSFAQAKHDLWDHQHRDGRVSSSIAPTLGGLSPSISSSLHTLNQIPLHGAHSDGRGLKVPGSAGLFSPGFGNYNHGGGVDSQHALYSNGYVQKPIGLNSASQHNAAIGEQLVGRSRSGAAANTLSHDTSDTAGIGATTSSHSSEIDAADIFTFDDDIPETSMRNLNLNGNPQSKRGNIGLPSQGAASNLEQKFPGYQPFQPTKTSPSAFASLKPAHSSVLHPQDFYSNPAYYQSFTSAASVNK